MFCCYINHKANNWKTNFFLKQNGDIDNNYGKKGCKILRWKIRSREESLLFLCAFKLKHDHLCCWVFFFQNKQIVYISLNSFVLSFIFRVNISYNKCRMLYSSCDNYYMSVIKYLEVIYILMDMLPIIPSSA